MTTTKTVARRDSATTILRKIGINVRDYNAFIKADGDKFIVNVGAAQKHVDDLLKPAKTTKPAKSPKSSKAAPSYVTTIVAPAPGTTTSAYIQGLIRAGYTNSEIFEALKKFMNFDESKSYYPAWNRWKMRKNGEAV